MNCCDTSYDLGCIARCDTIPTGLTAAITGTYQVVYHISNGIFRYDIDFTLGESIVLDNIFNESFISTFSILDPAGNYLTIDGETCFKITIR